MDGTVKVEKYIMADDSRMNYCFIKQKEIDNPNKDLKVDWDEIDKDTIDYGVVVEKGEPETEDYVGTLDKVLPSSFLSVKTQEDCINWYSEKYPEYPDGFAEILARYQFKEDKNNPLAHQTGYSEKKKQTSKKKSKPTKGLTIKQGPIKVIFD